MRRRLGKILADPVIVMARPEFFGDIVEEVRRDAVDFPLEVDGRREPVVLPSVSMVAATLPRRKVGDLYQDRRVERIFDDDVVTPDAFPNTGEKVSEVRDIKKALGFHRAEKLGFTGRGSVVSVLDTGINLKHPAFEAKRGLVYAHGVDKGPYSVVDQDSHGTAMNFVSCGGRDGPHEGAAPDAELHSVKISYRTLGKIGVASTSRILQAMDMALGLGSDVVNTSFGTIRRLEKPVDSPYFHFLDRNFKGKTVHTTSAGNRGPVSGTIGSPGVEPIQITVGNYTTLDGEVAVRSSRGPTPWDDALPDMVLPGNYVWAADHLQPSYRRVSGTSTSSALTSGLIAIMCQAWRELLGRRLLGHEVKRMLNESAKGLKSNESGWGTLTWDLAEWWLTKEYGVKL